MFDTQDGAGAFTEVQACRKAYPNHYIKVNGYNRSLHQADDGDLVHRQPSGRRAELRAGRAILKPVYQHKDGTFGPPVYTQPKQFTLIEGLLGYHTEALRDCYDVLVFLDPPEELRRQWKVQRDCSRRGYTTDEVLEELDRREPDSELDRPQRRWADIVVSFQPGRDQDHLDAEIVLRKGLDHPDLSEFVDAGGGPDARGERERAQQLFVPGDIAPARGSEIEEAVWGRMHFASHLRSERLGEFTVGRSSCIDPSRSPSCRSWCSTSS